LISLSVLGLTIIKKSKSKEKEFIRNIEEGLSSPVTSMEYDGISTNTSFTDPNYKSRISQALDYYFTQIQNNEISDNTDNIETNTKVTNPIYKKQIQNAINKLMNTSKFNDKDIIYETEYNKLSQCLSNITESDNDYGSIIKRFSHLALNNFNNYGENNDFIDSNDNIVIKPESTEIKRKFSLFSSKLLELCLNKPLPPLPNQSIDLNKFLPLIPSEIRESIQSNYSVDSDFIKSIISNAISDLSMGTLPEPLLDSVLNMSLFPLIIITKKTKNIISSFIQ
jgi:hypothetical protein